MRTFFDEWRWYGFKSALFKLLSRWMFRGNVHVIPDKEYKAMLEENSKLLDITYDVGYFRGKEAGERSKNAETIVAHN